jgi:hypothetical protein
MAEIHKSQGTILKKLSEMANPEIQNLPELEKYRHPVKITHVSIEKCKAFIKSIKNFEAQYDLNLMCSCKILDFAGVNSCYMNGMEAYGIGYNCPECGFFPIRIVDKKSLKTLKFIGTERFCKVEE